MMRRRGWRPPRRAPKQKTHWTRDISILTAVTPATVVGYDLVTPAIYNQNTGVSPGGVTVLRTIMDISITQLPQQNGITRYWWALWAVDSGSALTDLNPGDGQDLTDERVLACGVGTITNQYAAGASSNSIMVGDKVHIDCRQKVRLEDTSVIWTILNDTASPGNINFCLVNSVLLRGDIT